MSLLPGASSLPFVRVVCLECSARCAVWRIEGFAVLLAVVCPDSEASPVSAQQQLSDQDISDSYIYLLGRLLITRQQQLDFQEGFKWNELVHRKPGEVDWPNPNLDVAYSEAWVAADEIELHDRHRAEGRGPLLHGPFPQRLGRDHRQYQRAPLSRSGRSASSQYASGARTSRSPREQPASICR